MCNQSCHHGITFTVVADGKLLSYLYVMDLCTIFGNALDNAIEYELQLKNPETRMIHVKIYRKKKFICILVENYYEGSWNGKGEKG